MYSDNFYSNDDYPDAMLDYPSPAAPRSDDYLEELEEEDATMAESSSAADFPHQCVSWIKYIPKHSPYSSLFGPPSRDSSSDVEEESLWRSEGSMEQALTSTPKVSRETLIPHLDSLPHKIYPRGSSVSIHSSPSTSSSIGYISPSRSRKKSLRSTSVTATSTELPHPSSSTAALTYPSPSPSPSRSPSPVYSYSPRRKNSRHVAIAVRQDGILPKAQVNDRAIITLTFESGPPDAPLTLAFRDNTPYTASDFNLDVTRANQYVFTSLRPALTQVFHLNFTSRGPIIQSPTGLSFSSPLVLCHFQPNTFTITPGHSMGSKQWWRAQVCEVKHKKSGMWIAGRDLRPSRIVDHFAGCEMRTSEGDNFTLRKMARAVQMSFPPITESGRLRGVDRTSS